MALPAVWCTLVVLLLISWCQGIVVRSDRLKRATDDPKLFCYYSSYSQNRKDTGKFLPEDIDASLCTHVIFAFADVIKGTYLKPSSWNDLPNGKDKGLYARTQALKRTNPDLKVILAVGGWRVGSEPFTPMIGNVESRRLFIRSVVRYLRRHEFDGLDMDWEFPGTRGSAEDDKYHFTELIKDLQDAFEREARQTGRTKLLLTMAVAGGSYYINLAYEPNKIVKYVDYLLLMAYNYHGSWNEYTGHHSGLFPRSDEVAGEREWNQAWTIDFWVNQAGAPKDKVVVGIATYGMSFTLADQAQHGLKAAAAGGGSAGKYTKEAGTVAYYEVCENLRKGWRSVWIDEQKVPYAYDGDQWVGYDNLDSVTYKAHYIRKMGLAGAFIWSVEMDDFSGTCGTGKYPLLSTIARILRHGGPADEASDIYSRRDETFSASSSVEERDAHLPGRLKPPSRGGTATAAPIKRVTSEFDGDYTDDIVRAAESGVSSIAGRGQAGSPSLSARTSFEGDRAISPSERTRDRGDADRSNWSNTDGRRVASSQFNNEGSFQGGSSSGNSRISSTDNHQQQQQSRSLSALNVPSARNTFPVSDAGDLHASRASNPVRDQNSAGIQRNAPRNNEAKLDDVISQRTDTREFSGGASVSRSVETPVIDNRGALISVRRPPETPPPALISDIRSRLNVPQRVSSSSASFNPGMLDYDTKPRDSTGGFSDAADLGRIADELSSGRHLFKNGPLGYATNETFAPELTPGGATRYELRDLATKQHNSYDDQLDVRTGQHDRGTTSSKQTFQDLLSKTITDADQGGNKCTSAGLFPQPGSCRSYYICVRHGPRWYKFHLTCPHGLAFRPDSAACGQLDTCTE